MSGHGKYVSAMGLALRQGLTHRAATLGRVAFFAIILLIFSRVWRVVMPAGGSAAMIWYLAVTEWVLISVPMLHIDIEQDVRRGDIAYLLTRPASYLGMRLAEGLGSLLARMILLLPAGFLCAWLFSGGLPRDPRGLLVAVPVGVLGASVFLLFQASIGVGAFWLQDASPLYYIWQKLAFVFGGLILPLDIYPRWMRLVGAWTPFPSMLYGPGSLALRFDAAEAALVASKLLLWGIAAAALLQLLYRRGLRVLDVNGG